MPDLRGVAVEGEKVKKLRTDNFLTQEEMAQRLGISLNGVRRIERPGVHGVSFKNFRKLSENFGMDFEKLKAAIGVFRYERMAAKKARRPD